MNDCYLIHTRDGAKIFTHADLVNEARRQQAAGFKPMYKHREMAKPGFLVFSTYEDGAGVVILHGDNGQLVRGWQGDFQVIM